MENSKFEAEMDHGNNEKLIESLVSLLEPHRYDGPTLGIIKDIVDRAWQEAVEDAEQAMEEANEPEEVDIPETFEEAVNTLFDAQTEENIAVINTCSSADSFAGRHHMTFGRSIRNGWKLWQEGTPLRNDLMSRGLKHADDMSGVILKALWCRVMGEEYDMAPDIAVYDAHWAEYGDPGVTQ